MIRSLSPASSAEPAGGEDRERRPGSSWATQFFEFLGAIAAAGTDDSRVRLSTASFQPIAADDVAQAVAEAALGSPVNETIEIAGPERLPMSELVARYLKATNDPREVVSDAQARYFGTELNDHSLVPGDTRALPRRVSRTGSAAPDLKSKSARQGRRPDEAVRRTGDELRVHLSMLFRRIRLSIRDQVDREEGVVWWMCIHEFVSTKENTNVHEIPLRSCLRSSLHERSFSR